MHVRRDSFYTNKRSNLEECLHRFMDNSDESGNIFTRDRSMSDEYDFGNVPDPDVLKYLCQFNANNKFFSFLLPFFARIC